MEIELYLPYYDYNDESFDVNNTYKDSNDYINALRNEFNNSSNAVTDFMTGGYNSQSTAYIGNDGQLYQFADKGSQNEEKVAYTKCSCIIFNDEGMEETVDGMIMNFVKQEPFIMMVERDLDSCDEEFESEMSLWINEHKGINALTKKMGEEWVWKNEPVRELRGKFLNNANEEICVLFKNCKIMDLISANSSIFFIERMTMIDNFEKYEL